MDIIGPFDPLDDVLFVDFDGVLHPLSAGEVFLDHAEGLMKFQGDRLFRWSQALGELLAEHPSTRVAIHSSWRNFHDEDELRALLHPSLASRVVGATFRRMSRLESIEAFIVDHQVRRHAILDDDASEFPLGHPTLILCPSEDGFVHPPTLARLSAWLGSLGARPSPPSVKP